MLRFAVCISGDVRGFARVHRALEDNLLSPTRSSGATIDLFGHVWCDGSALENEGVQVMRRVATRIVVEPTEQRRALTAATYGWGAAHASSSFENFRSQWRKVYLAFRLAAEYAALNKQTFDAYVRTRPDMLHLAPHNLAAEHNMFVASAYGVSGQLEYVATQDCLAPWPLAVPDQWAVATPELASAYAALPTAGEPDCCERWLEFRLVRGMRVFPSSSDEDPSRFRPPSASGSTYVCMRGGAKHLALKTSDSHGRPLFYGRLHAVILGERCFYPKMAKKLRLPADDASCVPSSDGGVRGLVAQLAVKRSPASSADGPATVDALTWVNSTGPIDGRAYSDWKLRTSAAIRRSACRCARGVATANRTVTVPLALP